MAKLLVLGPEGRKFEFKIGGDITTIGRVDENDLVLSYASVSRKHASLERRVFGYFIKDLESTNGTIVNGEYIQEKRLNDRDEIFLGELMLVFFYDDTEYDETFREDRTPSDAYESPLAGAAPSPGQSSPASRSTSEIDIRKILQDKKREG
jgi:pSer/pThr/pTyr-binding forkhead associated (FHA) protein